MQLATVRACLDAIAARGRDPALRGSAGVWELDLEGDTPETHTTWSIAVDDADSQ